MGNAAPQLRGRNCELVLDRPRIMGILNVTPDSFYDGGRHGALDQARRHAAVLAGQGADLIDVGGESTRPGAAGISVAEELERVLPVIEALRQDLPLPISIDTTKSEVAAAALAAGADFVNDVSGLRFDVAMAAAVMAGGGGLFLMHTSGRPEQMQQRVAYPDLFGAVRSYLLAGVEMAVAAGIPRDKLALDPGIGFGKSVAGNLELLRRLDELVALGFPVLLGTSRKSFIGRVLDQPEPEQRLAGTLATVALGVAKGALLLRVHDVAAAREAALMAFAVCREDAYSPS